MNCIKVKRNNLLNSIYSSVSPDFRFKETPYINFYTDPELSSSLYHDIFLCVTSISDLPLSSVYEWYLALIHVFILNINHLIF